MLEGSAKTSHDLSITTPQSEDIYVLLQNPAILYSELFQNASEAIIILNLLGNITDANKAAVTLTGINRYDLIGIDICNLISSNKLKRIINNPANLLPANSCVTFNSLIAGKNKVKKNVEIEIKMVAHRGRPVFIQFNIKEITNYAKALKKLKKYEYNYKTIFENKREGDLIFDKKMNLLLVNTTTASYLGFNSVKEFSNYYRANFLGFIAPGEREWFIDLITNSLFNQEPPRVYDILRLHRSGKPIRMAVKCSSIMYRNKEACLVSLKKINKIKQTEEALSKSEEINKIIVETAGKAGIGIVILQDTEYQKATIVFINDEVPEMLGYKKEELAGKPIWEIISDEDHEMVMKNYIMRQKGEDVPARYEVMAVRKDRTLMPVEVSPSAIEYKGKVATIKYITDITKRKRMEETLRKSEESAKAYLEGAPYGVYISDLNGVFLYGSRKAEEITGYKAEELIGKNFLKLNLLPKRYLRKAAKLLELNALGKPTGPNEFELRCKNGNYTWVEIDTTTIEQKARMVVIGFIRDISERKKVDSELQLRVQLLDSAGDSISVNDFFGNLVYVNETFCRSHGYSRDELLKMNFRRLDLTELGTFFESRLEELRQKDEITFEAVHFRKDGSTMDVEVHSRVIESGGMKLILNVERDITKRKLMDKELRESEAFNHRLLVNSPIPINVINPDTSIKYVNPALEKLIGYSSEELVGKRAPYPFWQKSAGRKAIKELKQNMQHGAKEVELPFQKKNGEECWIQINSTPVIIDGEFSYLLSSWIDISERKKAEEELKHIMEFNSILLDNSPNPILVLNSDTSIKYANPALQELTGYSSDEILGTKPPFPWWSESDHSRYLRNIKKGMKKQLAKRERRQVNKKGEIVWVEVSSALVSSNEGTNYYISNWTDITERKLFRENQRFYISQITRAQEEERRRISREIHDDSIQALAAISLELGVLNDKRKYTLAEEISQHLKQIHSDTIDVLDGLRSFSHRLRPGLIDQVGLIPALENLVEEQNKDNKVTFTIKVSGTEKRLSLDEELILFRIAQEAIRNINRHSKATEATVKLYFGTKKVALTVTDNGIGFNFTGNLNSLANDGKLGLIGMQERASLLDGNLHIKSADAKGTKIIVEVPLKNKSVP